MRSQRKWLSNSIDATFHLATDLDGFKIVRPFGGFHVTTPAVREAIVRGLKAAQSTGDPRILAKWRWLAQKFDEQVDLARAMSADGVDSLSGRAIVDKLPGV